MVNKNENYNDDNNNDNNYDDDDDDDGYCYSYSYCCCYYTMIIRFQCLWATFSHAQGRLLVGAVADLRAEGGS